MHVWILNVAYSCMFHVLIQGTLSKQLVLGLVIVLRLVLVLPEPKKI
jgi:hypothetical protein